ncbi:MAG: hypothetical protein Tsb0016_02620 [Sphingomonadales bacterium]
MTKKVIIIGAGVIGCAVALELSRRGYQTLNIDKNAAAGAGSTSSSCAIVRFSYSTLESVKLSYEGHFYWKNWRDYLGLESDKPVAKFIACGALVIKTSDDDRADLEQFYRQLDIPFEIWTSDQICQRLPIYSAARCGPPRPLDDPEFYEDDPTPIPGGLFTPDAGYVDDPQLAADNLRRAAEALGGQFLFNREVVAIHRKDGHVTGVGLSHGETLDADIIVNVAGPHSFVINRMAGVEDEMRVKTRALRREVHHVPSPRGFAFEGNGICTSDTNIGVYFKPTTGNKISVGSGDPVCDSKTFIDDPDEYDRNIWERQWQTQVYRLAKRIPELPIPNTGVGVVDLYDLSDDWTPIYDKSSLGGFYMAIGTSGHQFKNAAVAGALMAALIEYCESGHDQDQQPLHFSGKWTGFDIDTGAFSRLRNINTKSSFSVRG